MLAGIAEFERELIKARTGEGRTRAKARGVKFGRTAPTAGSYPATHGRAITGRCGAELQRQPSYDIEARR